MKKALSLALALCISAVCSAQTDAIRSAIATYDFDQADNLIQKEMAALRKKKQSTEALERMQDVVIKAKSMLHATEKVTIVDSIVVPRSEVLQHIIIGADAGTLQSYEQAILRPDSMDCTVHTNQLGNQRYLSEADDDGYIHLYREDLIGGNWAERTSVKGLQDDADAMNYPFILPDGVTLYYAARCDESLGGYDIYMTRYDMDEGTFMTPENIGMPFNSPANDYLMVIDEYNKLGWFVSDRGQSGENVCIYIFIPNDSRRIYSQETSSKQLKDYARIHSIHDTWDDKQALTEAKVRLNALREAIASVPEKEEFCLVIKDGVKYTSLTQFQNAEARKKATFWIEAMEQLQKDRQELDKARRAYAQANDAERQKLSAHIITLEQRVESITHNLPVQEKEIRKLELGL